MAESVRLYFCNGWACNKNDRKYCYKEGGDCFYTTQEEFSLTKMYTSFPPTTFSEFGRTGVLVETWDTDQIFYDIAEGKKFRIES